jgi:hypothetical protein
VALRVPRLRAMVGANAVLDETLRVALPNLARDNRTFPTNVGEARV